MKPREITIHMTSDTINVSADTLWTLVGPGFADVGAWTTSVDKSFAVGTPQLEGAPCNERECHVNISGYDKMIETLTLFDADSRQIAYEVTEGVPGFVLLARNHWTIREVGPGRSVAEMACTMRLSAWAGLFLGGTMKRTVARNLKEVFQELKVYAETGDTSAQKKSRLRALSLAG